MNLALWSAKTGLDAQNTQMAIIANNLANANTTGFKSDRAAFQDLLYQNIRQVGAQSTQNTQYSTGLTLGTGVRIVATEKNYAQGSVTQTNGSSGLVHHPAADSCRSRMPDGTLAYTRDGSLTMDNPGERRHRERLSAAARDHHPRGYAVGHHRQRWRGHGACPPANKTTQIGQIQLADFINEEGLQPTGNNLLIESAASGAPQVGYAGHQRTRHRAAGHVGDLQRQHGHRARQHDRVSTRLRDELQSHHDHRSDVGIPDD